MLKEAVFTMKLEPELRDAFMAEAEATHRPASQIVRELMRDFVLRQREAREYDAFLRDKVEAARASMQAGPAAMQRFLARRNDLHMLFSDGAFATGLDGTAIATTRADSDRVGTNYGDRDYLRGALRDPSVFQWPLLEAAVEGNIVADFPICNKSFNCSYSGSDL